MDLAKRKRLRLLGMSTKPGRGRLLRFAKPKARKKKRRKPKPVSILGLAAEARAMVPKMEAKEHKKKVREYRMALYR